MGRPRGWRPNELVREATRNIGPRHLISGVLVTLLLTGLALLSSSQAFSSLEQEADRQGAGSLVVLVAADGERPLNAATCESMNASAGVEAAGGIAATRPPPAQAFAGSAPVTTEYVTPHAIRVWDPTSTTATTVVGADLSATGAVGPGTVLLWPDGAQTRVASELTPSVPVTRLRSGVLVPRTTDTALSECWVRMSPGAVDYGVTLASYVFRDAGAQIVPFTTLSPGVKSPSQQWHAYADAQPWVVGALMLALVAGLTTWTRRTELAIYRAFGTGRAAITFMLLIEQAVVLLPSMIVASLLATLGSAAIAGHRLPPDVPWLINATIAAAGLLGYALSAITCQLGVAGGLAEQLKDR